MKNILLTIIATAFLFGCSDPEAEANKLFTEASQLVKDADAITEPYSLEAYKKRKAAIDLIEKFLPEDTYIDKNYTGRNGDGYNFAKVRIVEIPRDRSIDIDDKFDLDFARNLYKRNNS